MIGYEMKIYKVVRYGCDQDPDGTDGVDTIFLVRSQDHLVAAEIVDNRLKALPHENVSPFSQCIYEIGEDISKEKEALVIMGPSYENAYNYGGYPTFIRECEDEEWALE